MFTAKGNALEYRREGETLRIEPWGSDALRVRAVMGREFSGRDWALLPARKRRRAPFGSMSKARR